MAVKAQNEAALHYNENPGRWNLDFNGATNPSILWSSSRHGLYGTHNIVKLHLSLHQDLSVVESEAMVAVVVIVHV